MLFTQLRSNNLNQNLRINFEIILQLREILYHTLEEYLSPSNNSDTALNLKNKLNKEIKHDYSETENKLESFLKQKARRASIIKEFIHELFRSKSYDNLLNQISIKELEFLKDLIINDLVYYGPITALISLSFKDSPLKELLAKDSLLEYYANELVLENILEIQVNSHNEVFIETKKEFKKIHLAFISENHLKSVIERLISESNQINKYSYQINYAEPILDFNLAFTRLRGSAIFPPASKNHCLTIRIHPENAYDLDYLEKEGMFNDEIKDFLIACQQAGLNLAIAGTMGTGKTTLLSALFDEWPKYARKAIIEDTPELNPNNEDTLFLKLSDYKDHESKIDIHKLVKACKRHSIKYIALSEARDGAAWEILQLAQNILGCLMTFHFTVKHSPYETSKALDNLVYLSKLNPNTPSDNEVKLLITKILNILILIEQSPTTKKRIIRSISYIQGYDEINTGHYKYIELFKYDGSKFIKMNKSSELEDFFTAKGVHYKF